MTPYRICRRYPQLRECPFGPVSEFCTFVGGEVGPSERSHVAPRLEFELPARRIRVIAEPGRFYVSNAFRLAANIIARRAPLGAPSDANANGGHADVTEPKVMCE